MKQYLIVGATSGIGLALKSLLERSGHQAISISRTTGFDARTNNPELTGITTLDGLVYCPGTIKLKPFARITDEDILDDFQVNALGAARTIRAVLPQLKAAESASIVLFSTVAVQTGMPFHASIAMAKGAIEGLTRSLAAELAPKIRVNAIAPSITDTTLAAALLNSDAKRQAAADRHPLKRIGTPEDLAALAAFLLGTDSQWITGQILHADGGLGALKAG